MHKMKPVSVPAGLEEGSPGSTSSSVVPGNRELLEEEESLCGCGCRWIAHVPVDDPTPIGVRAVLTGLSRLLFF